jgi:hypothetical protein
LPVIGRFGVVLKKKVNVSLLLNLKQSASSFVESLAENNL